MAKRDQDEPETEGEQDNIPTKPIPGSVLKKLVSNLRRHQDDIDEIKGTMGGEVNAITGKYAISKKVIAQIRGLAKLSAEALADHLQQLDHALSVSGLRDRAASVKRLPFGEGEQGEADQDGEGGASANGHGSAEIKKFPAPQGAQAS